jgi:hypothetical protein
MANLSGRFGLCHAAREALEVMLRSHWRYKKNPLLRYRYFQGLTLGAWVIVVCPRFFHQFSAQTEAMN